MSFRFIVRRRRARQGWWRDRSVSPRIVTLHALGAQSSVEKSEDRARVSFYPSSEAFDGRVGVWTKSRRPGIQRRETKATPQPCNDGNRATARGRHPVSELDGRWWSDGEIVWGEEIWEHVDRCCSKRKGVQLIRQEMFRSLSQRCGCALAGGTFAFSVRSGTRQLLMQSFSLSGSRWSWHAPPDHSFPRCIRHENYTSVYRTLQRESSRQDPRRRAQNMRLYDEYISIGRGWPPACPLFECANSANSIRS